MLPVTGQLRFRFFERVRRPQAGHGVSCLGKPLSVVGVSIALEHRRDQTALSVA
ncbi:MAG: hypothetical protein R3E45_02620 [Rhodocyclaceae bacterium]